MNGFILNGSEHTAGDHRCEECYKGYPGKCVCGGFIHAQFVKESWDTELRCVTTICNFSCDLCRSAFKFFGQVNRKFRKRKFNNKRR